MHQAHIPLPPAFIGLASTAHEQNPELLEVDSHPIDDTFVSPQSQAYVPSVSSVSTGSPLPPPVHISPGSPASSHTPASKSPVRRRAPKSPKTVPISLEDLFAPVKSFGLRSCVRCANMRNPRPCLVVCVIPPGVTDTAKFLITACKLCKKGKEKCSLATRVGRLDKEFLELAQEQFEIRRESQEFLNSKYCFC
jgi:hypothetical protein